MFWINSCKISDVLTVPQISTANISGIDSVSAHGGGEVTKDGGSKVFGRGVCYSITSNPTIANNMTTDGTGSGVFTSTLTGLTPNTTYYVRAYAINNTGTGYGNLVTFTTLP